MRERERLNFLGFWKDWKGYCELRLGNGGKVGEEKATNMAVAFFLPRLGYIYMVLWRSTRICHACTTPATVNADD